MRTYCVRGLPPTFLHFPLARGECGPWQVRPGFQLGVGTKVEVEESGGAPAAGSSGRVRLLCLPSWKLKAGEPPSFPPQAAGQAGRVRGPAGPALLLHDLREGHPFVSGFSQGQRAERPCLRWQPGLYWVCGSWWQLPPAISTSAPWTAVPAPEHSFGVPAWTWWDSRGHGRKQKELESDGKRQRQKHTQRESETERRAGRGRETPIGTEKQREKQRESYRWIEKCRDRERKPEREREGEREKERDSLRRGKRTQKQNWPERREN